MELKTIDDVIGELGEIMQWSEANKSRMGYFPSLYRKVTIRVKEEIAAGEFEVANRMENLDVVFASRYIDAFHAWQKNEPCSKSWEVAFTAAPKWRYIVLQHLLVGMNAHINFDLAIAAAEIAPGSAIHDLEADFKQITGLLNDLTDSVKQDLTQVWPLLRILDWFGGRLGDWLANLGMKIARNIAWENAVKLALLDPAERKAEIQRLDAEVGALGDIILSPSVLANQVIRFIRLGELKTVKRIIGILSD